MRPDYPYFGHQGLALLMIDDPDDQATIDEGFRLRGWQVRAEHDVATAMELLLQDQVAMFVTDDMDTVRLVAQSFRFDTADGPVNDGPPVFVIATDDEEILEAYDQGADMVIRHPVSVEEFFQYRPEAPEA